MLCENSLDDKQKNLIEGKQRCKVSSITLKSSSDQVLGSEMRIGFCPRPHLNTCSQISTSFICKSSLLISCTKDSSGSEVKLGDLNIFSGNLAINSVQNCRRSNKFIDCVLIR